MADTELIDHTGRTVFRGTQKPPGGGSQSLKIITVSFADILANQLGDGSNAAPLGTVPAGAALTIIGYVINEAFNDSSVTGSDTFQVVDDADAANLAPWGGNAILNTPSTPDVGPFYSFTLSGITYLAASAAPIWLLFATDWAFDGSQGSADVAYRIETAA